jgi:hypothetical protein
LGHKKGEKGRCTKCRRARIQSKKYGLTFEEALAIPDNCEICDAHADDVPWNCMTADHDHETGKFRGWLCGHCNKGLGGFKDDIELIKKTYRYLKRFS